MEAQEILATLQQRGATVRALEDGRVEVAKRARRSTSDVGKNKSHS